MTIPDIEYTRSGDVSIAYLAFGHGPRNVVFAPQFSNLVFPWDNVDWRGMYERLSSFSRVIIFDKRGTGLSDRPRDLGPLETRMDDIRAVIDAVGGERVSQRGTREGGPSCALLPRLIPSGRGRGSGRARSGPRDARTSRTWRRGSTRSRRSGWWTSATRR